MTIFPNVIYFCDKTINTLSSQQADLWKRLNPNYEIKLYDNQQCRTFLLETYGELYVNIFDFLKDGPIKADFWRICILYTYGGVYSDIDNIPIIAINDFIEEGIDFLTCSAYMGEMAFNPNFIISNKDNIILKKCIEWYIDKYKNNHEYSYWEWSIMKTFTDVLKLDNYNRDEGIYNLDNIKIQIIKECPGNDHYDAHNVYKEKIIFNNSSDKWAHENHCFILE